MKMFDATLDLARFAQGVDQYKITAISTTGQVFTCSALSASAGEYTNGGTCWFMDGNLEGKFATISEATGSTVTLRDVITDEDNFEVGDTVCLSGVHYFDTQELINAVNHVLYDYPIMDVYEDTTEDPQTYKHTQYEYTLPDEVGLDIRRVELQSKNWHIPWSATLPDTFTICHYWKLVGNKLVIAPKYIYKYGGRIKIHYVKSHGLILDPDTETINEQVDKTYLRKMANLWLWTHEIQQRHKDNPIAVDMFNQAKMDEDALGKKNIPELKLMPKDICYFW